ncbi:acyl-CoA synthetase [Minwuia thermotolerans]|uniref:Acyl-CoA synthetase n=1 Tax=Minwuia thermotolerans TaxID=2056226 RepID=A0A2M9G7M5_9PROT|nr:acyl-CoA synthetase [Minwuia thermotolerans]PJK31727.1 acyl-CoA synthetase [Minwuia thermotolerans]
MLALAEISEAAAEALGDRTAIVYRDRRFSFAEVADRSRRLANFLLSKGLTIHRERGDLQNWESGQDHVALYMYNCNEYIESLLGGYKARAVPFNVNFRYVREELVYLLNDARAKAMIYHAAFAPMVKEVRRLVPTLEVFIQVEDGSGHSLLDDTYDYETALAESNSGPTGMTCSPDDIFMLYTGGTTGMPRGVLWRQADAYVSQMGGLIDGDRAVSSIKEVVERAVGSKHQVIFVPPPFMHGAGKYVALRALYEGNTVLIQSITDRLDPSDILGLVEKERANLLLVIGDAYGRPLLEELDRGDYDTSSLRFIANTGAILSPAVKRALMERIPRLTIVDTLGSSETGVQALHVTGGRPSAGKGDFRTIPGTAVLDAERGRRLEPGTGEVGWLAKHNFVPLGYLGDPEKTRETFPVIDGIRYVVGGDRVRLLADGQIEYLGRDSMTINSGGEKIFAEEVERALRHHPKVADVLVVGRPSERWGQDVVAVVQGANGEAAAHDELLAEAAQHIARYKLPKAFVFVERIGRLANGKPDYAWARKQVEEHG